MKTDVGKWIVHKKRRSLRYTETRKDGTEFGDSGIEILQELINKDGSCGGYHTIIGHENCQPWNRVLTEENAEFICQACNAHDELIEACKIAIEHMGDIDGTCEMCGGNGAALPYHDLCPCKKIRAALSKAEGGTP